tara:strand:- start:4940 stop:5722 length:783 start_codon:yes stop_codon:yes gene_type:complete
VRFDAEISASKTISITQGLQSESTTSGDLVVSGGVGIAKSVYIGGNLIVSGIFNGGSVEFGNVRVAQSDTNTIDTKSGNLILDSTAGNVEVKDNLDVVGVTSITGNTSVGGNLNITPTSGTTLVVSSETQSNDKTSGAVTIAGGVGIGKDLHVGGDITAFASSDINLKENLSVIPNAIDKVNAIAGYTYRWKTTTDQNIEPYCMAGELDTGVIAQEVEALGLPGITTTRDDGTMAVRYERLVPLLIQAIKELNDKVNSLS